MGLVLVVGLPVGWAVASTVSNRSFDVGFDYLGTLWEPGRAVLHGGPIYAEPTRAAVVIGNPSLYPPLFILLTVPLSLLPATAASWLWSGILALCVCASLRILGLRDWRLYVLAVLSPVVLHGLYYGNLTLALMVPLAVAWRFRDSPWVTGSAVAVAVAAKLFAWPLVFWLLFTRRFRAAAVSVGLGAVLLVVPWALIGFEGLSSYPDLLRRSSCCAPCRTFTPASASPWHPSRRPSGRRPRSRSRSQGSPGSSWWPSPGSWRGAPTATDAPTPW